MVEYGHEQEREKLRGLQSSIKCEVPCSYPDIFFLRNPDMILVV